MLLKKDFVSDVRGIIDNGRKRAYSAVEQAGLITFWNIGKRIVEEQQHGDARATYGSKLIQNLADIIVPIYGNTYNKRNLDYYKKFYLTFPDFEIVNTRVHNLEWSHIRRVLSVTNSEARLWYLENASINMWSVRELDRNISTQYFERR